MFIFRFCIPKSFPFCLEHLFNHLLFISLILFRLFLLFLFSIFLFNLFVSLCLFFFLLFLLLIFVCCFCCCFFVSSFIHSFIRLLMHCYRFVVLPQPVCLERGVSYKLRVEFIRYAARNSIITSTNAFVLVDSVSIDLWFYSALMKSSCSV